MAAFFRQVKLLLWKNLLLQRRKKCVSVFEIFFPVFFAVIFMFIRYLAKPEFHDDPVYYPPDDIFEMHNGFTAPTNNYTVDLMTCELGFAPNHSSLFVVMTKVASRIHPNDTACANMTPELKPFATEADLTAYYKINSEKMKMAVVFRGSNHSRAALSPDLHLVIRQNSEYNDQWNTRDILPYFQMGPRSQLDPDYSQVVKLQMLVGSAVVEEWSGQNVSVRWQTNRMPYPPYLFDGMVQVLMTMIPAFIMLSFMLPVIQYIKGIVYEKERKLKESMKLMGLLPSAHWAAWFFTCMIFMVITMAIYTVFLGVSFTDHGPAIGNGDVTLFFVFMLVYAVAIVTYCFMISAMIQKANIAAVVGGLVYFGLYIPYIFLNLRYETLTYSEKMALGLLFNSAMALGMKVIGLYVGTGEGISWSTIAEPATPDDNFSFLDVLIMLLVDSAIHLTVTWYLDNVRPGEFGVPKPFYFPFTKSYWCGPTSQYKDTGFALNTDDEHFESEPQGLKAGISVDKLRKEFGKNKVAVNNVSLKMYEGQITVLLGHNGAGKTTTMFMLTGFLPPSSGTATINGLDIRNDMDTIRHNLGLCPQHNILFDAMTVEEHLDFFARLKGCPASRVKEEVDKILTEVGLEFKRHAQSQTLSGGQKRKLSVGIALINDSKVVILDEPTSGMDPASRRQTWEVLQRHRAGRTMLLTTHFMDEADLLGDRIAIMAEGVVQCCGSSMFLKKLYGTGYHLVLVKTPSCHVDKVTSVIQQHIPAARFESEINTELSYLLPDDQAALFPDLFRQLETRKEELGIGGFGTTATTMEEVFLK
ncbi:hypothetical protein V1264_019927 [Littorina saxatilis]|uniref:ABC transporter domain-containing protein n=2 Tax=Littorina saxatilis TaxID=31220 RepID=A0AAN9BA67_9CAEN